jgi:hypothetical protein
LGVVNIEGMLMLMGAFKEIRDHEAEAKGVSNFHESPVCELYSVKIGHLQIHYENLARFFHDQEYDFIICIIFLITLHDITFW